MSDATWMQGPLRDHENEPNRSQETPDIVPPYMARRIEAMRRYPVEDGRYPGVDRNAAARQGFIDGAEWEAEQCQTHSTG